MPAIFDLEYYARLKPGPGTGPGRSIAAFLAYAIRDRATVLNIGPSRVPNGIGGAEFWRLVDGRWHEAIPPPIAAAKVNARFLKQLVAGNGALTLKIGERTLDVSVEFTTRPYLDEINVTLPVSSALQGAAGRLLEAIMGPEGYLEFLDEEYDIELKEKPRRGFPLYLTAKKGGWDGAPFLGRQRMPFHPDMHAPTKFLMMALMMCSRDRATTIRFSPHGDDLWTRYLVDNAWHDWRPPPRFVWPQLVRVIERHAILIRPESDRVDAPAIGWLELRWGLDLPPDNLAIYLDTREDSPLLEIKFLKTLPKATEPTKPAEDADPNDDDDPMTVEFSPDDQ